MTKTTLHILPSENYFKEVIKIIQQNINKKIVFVTANKPYSNIKNLLEEEGINSNNIFFIDCISTQLLSEKEAENCIFLEHPSNITGISIAIDQAINLIKGEKIIILDSLSTLLIYNSENVIGRFSNSIINKLRTENVPANMFMLDSDVDKNIFKIIESFADEVKR